MGTKTTTKTNTNNSSQNAFTFDPQSMNRYQGWQNSMMPQLQNLFQNPFSSPFFNMNMQQQTKGASQVAGRNMQNSMLNFQRSGIGGGSLGGGAMQSLLSGLGRYGSGLQYQGFMNSVNQAQSDRWNAASLGSSLFQPMQTGGTASGSSSGVQTQQTGGLGTWLPQLVGAGLGMATGGGFGGLGKLFGGGSAASGNIGAIGQSGGTSGFLGGSLGNTGGFGGMPAMGAFNPLAPPTNYMPGVS